jgi:DNA polymerase III alpha subunit
LELKKSEDFSFERILAEEKEMLGFSVSGHALDGLKKFCLVRSQKTRKLKMSFEELEELRTKKSKQADEDNFQNGEKIQAV